MPYFRASIRIAIGGRTAKDRSFYSLANNLPDYMKALDSYLSKISVNRSDYRSNSLKSVSIERLSQEDEALLIRAINQLDFINNSIEIWGLQGEDDLVEEFREARTFLKEGIEELMFLSTREKIRHAIDACIELEQY